MLIFIRILIFFLIIYLLYRAFKYIVNPKRKLELAMEQKKFYFLDDQENVRKNFLVTYKGVLFQGEKYLGTTDRAFDVVSIFVWVENASSLKGISYEDLKYVETEILERYPNASIDWKSPLKEFIYKKKKPEME
ncbi:sigma-w pathway protein ysdB [Bacillus salacetis]|uniref:sigma-w pathway protein ysdB n=1 Tax=Bacillus salacetis TaxID=2315464 RepID=UPI003BA3D755